MQTRRLASEEKKEIERKSKLSTQVDETAEERLVANVTDKKQFELTSRSNGNPQKHSWKSGRQSEPLPPSFSPDPQAKHGDKPRSSNQLRRHSKSAKGSECEDVYAYALRHEGLKEKGGVLVLEAFRSLGNFFLSLHTFAALAKLCDVALMIDTQGFPDFNIMLEPAAIQYHVEPGYIASMEKQGKPGVFQKIDHGYFYTFPEHKGLLPNISAHKILNEQMLLAALEKRSPGTKMGTFRCWLDALFKRTHFAKEAYAQQLALFPELQGNFTAWHIRTPDSEVGLSFNPVIHKHVLTENSTELCKLFDEVSLAQGQSNLPVFLSSDSDAVKESCTRSSNRKVHYLDGGALSNHRYHTKFQDASSAFASSATILAFLDLFFMAEAQTLIYSGSSFSAISVDYMHFECARVHSLKSGALLLHCSKPSKRVHFLDGHNREAFRVDSSIMLSKKAAKCFVDIRNIDILENPVVSASACGEALWCNNSMILQQRIYKWQNPSRDLCENAKFLLYEPPNYGIGSMIHIAASSLALAICTGRILGFPYRFQQVCYLAVSRMRFNEHELLLFACDFMRGE